MHRSLLILLSAVLLTLGGCGGAPSDDELAKRVRTATLSEDQAIEKAREAVRNNDSFADSAEYAASATGDDGWTITVTADDGFRLIVLDGGGEVIRYE